MILETSNRTKVSRIYWEIPGVLLLLFKENPVYWSHSQSYNSNYLTLYSLYGIQRKSLNNLRIVKDLGNPTINYIEALRRGQQVSRTTGISCYAFQTSLFTENTDFLTPAWRYVMNWELESNQLLSHPSLINADDNVINILLSIGISTSLDYLYQTQVHGVQGWAE